MNTISERISEYIEFNTSDSTTTGCFICGSYVAGNYNAESDIDILFIKKNHLFDMKLEFYKDLLFDRLFVDDTLLEDILDKESELSNILSLSFGLKHRIILTSPSIKQIISISRNNILKRNLIYTKDKNKPKKEVDGVPLYVKKIEGKHHLMKNDMIIV